MVQISHIDKKAKSILRILVTILLALAVENIYPQITGVYKSDASSDYFDTLLCLNDKWEFIYFEELDKNHVNSIYIEKGVYKIQGDTLFFNVEKVGFDDTPMSKNLFQKRATSENDKISMLNDLNEIYVKLKMTKNNKALRECKRIELLTSE